MSLFDPFIPPKPTVYCVSCKWEGVGVQTKLTKLLEKRGYAADPKCPKCGSKKIQPIRLRANP